MVTRWGMSEELGMVQLGPKQNEYLGVSYGNEKPFSEETAKKIDAAVLKIIGECHEESRRLLTLYRKQLDVLANALLDRETLDEEEILTVTGLPPAPELKDGKI
jgi:cell division protease FtsH